MDSSLLMILDHHQLIVRPRYGLIVLTPTFISLSNNKLEMEIENTVFTGKGVMYVNRFLSQNRLEPSLNHNSCSLGRQPGLTSGTNEDLINTSIAAEEARASLISMPCRPDVIPTNKYKIRRIKL